jgi:hypothetical protein
MTNSHPRLWASFERDETALERAVAAQVQFIARLQRDGQDSAAAVRELGRLSRALQDIREQRAYRHSRARKGQRMGLAQAMRLLARVMRGSVALTV